MLVLSYQIQESSKSAQLRVRAKQENVSGVMLPAFEMYNEGGNGKRTISMLLAKSCNWAILCHPAFEFTGLGRGGQQIQRAKEVYTKAVETLVELASLQVM